MRLLAFLPCFLLACSGAGGRTSRGQPGTAASFDLDADLDAESAFFDLPYPSDLRLTPSGAPRLQSFPNRRQLPIIESFKALALQRAGFPVLPVAYFHFGAALAPRDPAAVVAASPSSPVLLLDVDPSSPERGRLVPVVAATPPPDDYVPAGLLALAPRPGFTLTAHRTYAFVVLRTLGDAAGKALGLPAELDELRLGETPKGALGPAAAKLYAPLWPALGAAGVDPAQIAAATVFTTGDAVADTFALSEALRRRSPVQLTGLRLLPDAPGTDRVCLLAATVSYPQLQKGTPPFDSDGLFVTGPDGLPVEQRREEAPVVITLPRATMPPAGFPLLLYFHGSGGVSADVIDKGPSAVANEPQRGRGPAWVLAPYGIAAAASALPVNPERLPKAAETAYLNLQNPAAMRDTFRQGVIEQRLLLDALLALSIPKELVAGCGATLPAGERAFHFDGAHVLAQGQSMGGMYTNLVSAVEPRIRAAVPTGAGGFWTLFVLETQLHPGLPQLLALLLGADRRLTALHPALHLIETGWEPADPFVSMPRLARRPLPGHPVRPIYEPVAKGDQYFPTELYDAVALSYGHEQAGSVVWPSMQDALALGGLAGLRPYPVRDNLVAADGSRYTGVVVQYEGDGIEDPHAIYRQLDAVKSQYGCFFDSLLRTGRAVVFAPAQPGASCAAPP